jgi:hypothetical protein
VPGSKADKLPRTPWDPNEVNAADAFKQHLKDIGLKFTDEQAPAAALKASQHELDGPKVAAMMLDKRFDLVRNPLFISRDNYVVDGHHRWAAAVGRDAGEGPFGDLNMAVTRIDAPISEVLHLAEQWSIEFGIQQKSVPTAKATK